VAAFREEYGDEFVQIGTGSVIEVEPPVVSGADEG
jgi:hypothetical protein